MITLCKVLILVVVLLIGIGVSVVVSIAAAELCRYLMELSTKKQLKANEVSELERFVIVGAFITIVILLYYPYLNFILYIKRW